MVSATYQYLEGQLGQQGDYRHFFGHDPNVQGLSADYNGYDVQLIVTIDCADPLLADFNLPKHGLLRLAHPLYTSEGDEFIQEQPSDNEVVFEQLKSSKEAVAPLADHDWPYVGCPQFFPHTSVRFVRKQAPMLGDPDDPYPDLGVDKIIIGNPAPTKQDFRTVNEHGKIVYDRGCPKCGTEIQPTVTVPCLFDANPAASLSRQQTGYHWSVLTVFWVCRNCKTSISHNDCD